VAKVYHGQINPKEIIGSGPFCFDNLKLPGVRKLAASKLACALKMLLLPATTSRWQQGGWLKTGQWCGLSALTFFVASFLGRCPRLV
jgi:hypothetical protein